MGTVANLAVRISANAQDFEKGLAGVKSSTESTLGSLGKIGVALAGIFSISELTQAVERVGDWGGKITDFSNRLGMSADSVQRFKFAAEQGGSSIETIGRAIEFANRGMVSGDSGFVGALAKIGLTIQDIRALSPDQLFLTLAQAINATDDAAVKDYASQKLLGKAGQELQQILPDLIANFNTAPVAMDGAAAAADALGDSWERLKTTGETLMGNAAFVAMTAGQFTLGGEFISGLAKGINELASGGAPKELAKDIQLMRDATGQLDPRLKDLNLTVAEQEKRQRAAAAALREADKEAAAYRQTMNWLGEEMMKADRAQMDYFNNLGKGVMFMREHNNPQMLLQSSSLPTEALMALPGEVKQTIQLAAAETQSVWSGLLTNLQESTSYAFASMLLGATSFKDGFVSIWHSLRQSLIDIVSDLINNVLGGLMRGLGSMLGGGSFSAGFGGMGGILGGLFGGGGAAAGAGAGGAAAGAGAGGGSALGALFTNPWTAVAGGIAALGLGIWKGGLFRGGEEALKVNPARDAFLSQFGDVGNKGVGGAGHNLAAQLTAMGFGEGGGSLFANLQHADTMKEYEAAVRAVQNALETGTAQATTDTATLATTSETGSLAVNSLTASIAGLAEQALASAATFAPGGVVPTGAGIMSGIIDPHRYSNSDLGVVPPEDMQTAGGPTVVLQGTLIGNSQEFEDAVGRAYNNALESGGEVFNKARILNAQMAV